MQPFPVLVLFDVVRASMTDTLHNCDGNFEIEKKFNLVLRAEQQTPILLSSGEPLSEVDVHLSLSTRWRNPDDLDLSADDAGFLTYSDSGYGGEHIGGALIWPIETFPKALLANGVTGLVSLSLSTVPTIIDGCEPFVWNSGKLRRLKIASASISTVRELFDLNS